MKLCFPVQDNNGVDSVVYNHFGSAPVFLVVETDSDAVSAIDNRDQHHVHGACNPLKALDGRNVDAVIVGGIGAGALSGLNRAGVKVYRAQSGSVRENVALFRDSALEEYTSQGCCGGHGHDKSHGQGCAH